MMRHLSIPSLLLLCGSLALPAAAATADETLPPPSDGLLAAWVRDVLVSDSARHVPDTAEQLYARADLRADAAIARETTNRVLAGLGSDLTGPVVGCSRGIVTLRGRVASADRRDEAGRLAAAVPGVQGVHNLLLAPGEEPAAGPPPAPRDDGPGLTPPFHFLTEDRMAGRQMVVEAADGVVTLRGEVNSDRAHRHVVETARTLPGVRVVRNLTSVQPLGRDHDLRLAVLVHRRLEHEPELQPVVAHIEVSSVDGVVRLQGRVRSDYERSLARAVAADLALVFAVDDRLEIVPDLKPRQGADGPPRRRATTHEGTTLLKFGK